MNKLASGSGWEESRLHRLHAGGNTPVRRASQQPEQACAPPTGRRKVGGGEEPVGCRCSHQACLHRHEAGGASNTEVIFRTILTLDRFFFFALYIKRGHDKIADGTPYTPSEQSVAC